MRCIVRHGTELTTNYIRGTVFLKYLSIPCLINSLLLSSQLLALSESNMEGFHLKSTLLWYF